MVTALGSDVDAASSERLVHALLAANPPHLGEALDAVRALRAQATSASPATPRLIAAELELLTHASAPQIGAAHALLEDVLQGAPRAVCRALL